MDFTSVDNAKESRCRRSIRKLPTWQVVLVIAAVVSAAYLVNQSGVIDHLRKGQDVPEEVLDDSVLVAPPPGPLEQAYVEVPKPILSWQGIQANQSDVIHYPDLVDPTENEEIFRAFRHLKPDKNGYYEHELKISGKNGGYMRVYYKGKFVPNTHFYNMEHDDLLHKYGCTKDAIILEYSSARGAQRVAKAIQYALSSGSKYTQALLSGRQLLKCPKSQEPPEYHEGNVNFEAEGLPKPKETGIHQTLRKVWKVVSNAQNPKQVTLMTKFASLADAFEDLHFEGESNMVRRNGENMINIPSVFVEDDIDGIPLSKYDEYMEEQNAMETEEEKRNYRMFDDDEEEIATTQGEGGSRVLKKGAARRRLLFFKKIGKFFKKAAKAVVNTAKKVVGAVVNAVKSTVKFVAAAAAVVLKPIATLVGKLVPVFLNRGGTEHTGTLLSINYNSRTRKAARIWEFDTKGAHFGPFFAFGEKNADKQRKAAAVLISGRIACINCFARFYGGRFRWRVKIGGSKLAEVLLAFKFDVEAMIELEADITLVTLVAIPLGKYPIPALSIDLGFITLGFSIDTALVVGLKIAVQGFYYKYHLQGWNEAGIDVGLLGSKNIIKNGHMTHTQVGPMVRKGVSISLFLLPKIGLVCNDVAAVELGLQPTIKFDLKPKTPQCQLEWGVGFDIPIVVGAWVGLITRFGKFRLAGFSMAFSVIPFPKYIFNGCITPRNVADMQNHATAVRFNGGRDANNGARGHQAAVNAAQASFEANAKRFASQNGLSSQFKSQSAPSYYRAVGCKKDCIHGRILTHFGGRSDGGMTVERCATTCLGYRYFGVQYARECWCGNGMRWQTPASNCNMKCTGDSLQYCGGSCAENVYEYNFQSLGCKKDCAHGRVISDKFIPNWSGVSTQTCALACQGYRFFGTEYARECFCGNVAKYNIHASNCNMQCLGNRGQICGGSCAINMFQQISNYVYVGCKRDCKNGRALREKIKYNWNGMTTQACAAFCSGYKYFGTEYSKECFCGNQLVYNENSNNCKMRCSGNSGAFCGGGCALSVYELIPNYISRGCIRDLIGGQRVLRAKSKYNWYSITTNKCAQFCRGFKFFGTQYSRECFCGDTLLWTTAANNCNMRCRGNSNEFCGGGSAENVFEFV